NDASLRRRAAARDRPRGGGRDRLGHRGRDHRGDEAAPDPREALRRGLRRGRDRGGPQPEVPHVAGRTGRGACLGRKRGPRARRLGPRGEARLTSGPDETAVAAANLAFYRALEARDLSAMELVWLHEEAASCIHPGWHRLDGWSE